MGKRERAKLIQQNVAKNKRDTHNVDMEKIDKMYAYSIFLIEKEFNVGPITGEFPAMKFWNLLDEYNINKYNDDMEKQTKGSGNKPAKTFG